MKSTGNTLDRVANFATLITCVAICGVLGYNWLSSPADAADQEAQLRAMPAVYVDGTVLPAPAALTYADRPYTVLVGLNSRCRFCTESMPELQKLNAIAGSHSNTVRVIALAAEPLATVTDYLKANALTDFVPLPVDQDTPLSGVVKRTPSVVLVNRKGEVLKTWPGLVTESRMNEILEHLRQPGRP